MSTSPDGIYEPGVIDPGIPLPNPTQPFWLSEPSRISKLQSPWLETADVVIVGSGMTAASLTRSLYARRPALKIVLVEARELCSGATGRNGGHVKVMSPGVWFDRVRQYGRVEAIKVMQFEHGHLDAVVSCAKDYGVQCDLRLLEGLDCYHDEYTMSRAVRALEEMRKDTPELAARYTLYTSRSDLRARNCAEKCVGAIGMPSASMWPYKFVTALLEQFVDEKGLTIQTGTTVSSVEDDQDSEVAVVKTTRGHIRARHVVHATNAWMSHLIHELRPFVSPVRANVQHQVPQPLGVQVNNTFWLRYAEKDYDYMIQRPDGAFIMGRANTGRRATSDDTKKDLLPHTHLQMVVPKMFDFGTNKMQVTHAWSGCVAFTQDGNPFVGHMPFPGRSHQWVCGAYQGIGMVRAFRSAQMLAHMVLGEEIPPEFPRSMLVTEQRVEGLEKAIGMTKL